MRAAALCSLFTDFRYPDRRVHKTQNKSLCYQQTHSRLIPTHKPTNPSFFITPTHMSHGCCTTMLCHHGFMQTGRGAGQSTRSAPQSCWGQRGPHMGPAAWWLSQHATVQLTPTSEAVAGPLTWHSPCTEAGPYTTTHGMALPACLLSPGIYHVTPSAVLPYATPICTVTNTLQWRPNML